MRLRFAVLGCGLMAVAPAGLTQSLCDPCIDVPADYQPLEPLPTDRIYPVDPRFRDSDRSGRVDSGFDLGASISNLRGLTVGSRRVVLMDGRRVVVEDYLQRLEQPSRPAGDAAENADTPAASPAPPPAPATDAEAESPTETEATPSETAR